MHARIARFEGVEPDQMQGMVAMIRSDPRPPEGVPATRFMLLVDTASGTSLAISFFETEADMATGDEALEGMTPPISGSGRRTSVERYEVAIEVPD